MPMSQSDIDVCARNMALRLFVEVSQTATLELNQLRAIVTRIDQAMEATGQQVHALHPGQSLASAILLYVRAGDGMSGTTVQQVAIGNVVWSLRKAGLI